MLPIVTVMVAVSLFLQTLVRSQGQASRNCVSCRLHRNWVLLVWTHAQTFILLWAHGNELSLCLT